MIAIVGVLMLASVARADPAASLSHYRDRLDNAIIAHYMDPHGAAGADALMPPADLMRAFDPSIASAIEGTTATASRDLPTAVATIRALLQQGTTLALASAVERGDLAQAKRWRCQLILPRGASAKEGALLLQTLGSRPDKRDDAARLLVREAITWQTTLVRQELAELHRITTTGSPMPGRLREHVAEIITLASLPPAMAKRAGLEHPPHFNATVLAAQRQALLTTPWPALPAVTEVFADFIQGHLPSLLSDKEQARYERLLLKLVNLIPSEYRAGVRDGKISVPLEYQEAVSFTRQAKQLLGELAPLWLKDADDSRTAAVQQLDRQLSQAQTMIADIVPPAKLNEQLKSVAALLQDKLGVSLALYGSTADIVEEVMLQTRSLLGQSLAAAMNGQWAKAERLRLEAYTTYDPALEARLLPRDPQLATNIERLLLDGMDHPGVKALLDQHASSEQLQAAYSRVNDALAKATVLLKSDVSAVSAFVNATSIVLREGLEGLLVLVAILAGLGGKENAGRRRLVWLGVLAAGLVTAITWVVSQTIITSLSSYGEIIEAVTGLLAIGVLLLITNWLFQQVYWRQWIVTLKAQAQGESAWQLVLVGFAVGYREGFETVLFLQNLVLDAGKVSVGLGVLLALLVLILLGVLAIRLGVKLPYYKLLLTTAALIGFVLITFSGNTVRSLQTISWLPVHRILPLEWPMWMGKWLGMYNTWESVGGQLLACGIVLGTWRVARWQAKRRTSRRRAAFATATT